MKHYVGTEVQRPKDKQKLRAGKKEQKEEERLTERERKRA